MKIFLPLPATPLALSCFASPDNEILYNVFMVSGSFLFEILFWPPSHCILLPQTKAIGRAPERNLALNNTGFHPVSSEPPLSNTICRNLYYRTVKMESILSTFTILSLHLTGLLKLFPYNKMVNGRLLPRLRCSYYLLPWKPKC